MKLGEKTGCAGAVQAQVGPTMLLIIDTHEIGRTRPAARASTLPGARGLLWVHG